MEASTQPPRWRRWSVVGAATLLGLALLAVGIWVLLLPDVEAGPYAAVLEDPDVVVTETADAVTLEPSRGAVAATVVFYPGAGVPPAAYLATWAPVVEDLGVRVLVPSMPLRLAVLDRDAAAELRADAAAPGDGGQWWVGGHSLGGAMAAGFLADAPTGTWDGLVLWAAYPADDGLARRDDLAVVSVAGSRDGLTTPAEVDASRSDLPPGADVTVLDGVNHAQFGTYGDQRGDLTSGLPDAQARERIAEATADGMRAVEAAAGADGK